VAINYLDMAVKTATKPKSTKTASAVKKPAKKQEAGKVFAVIETGGKQYTVAEGDSLTVEKLGGDLKEGSTITFDKVLLLDDGKTTTVGTPYISGVKVTATFEEAGRRKKITVIKFKAKSRYLRKKGHRQPYSKIAITAIK